MKNAGISQKIEKNLQKILNIETHRPTDLSMLAMLADIDKPFRKSFRHYFDVNGKIIESGFNRVKPKHETIWDLLDEHNVPYKNDKIEHSGQALGVGLGKDIFHKVAEKIFKTHFGIGMPIVNNIFITKNKKDPNAEPYFVSSNESCEHILKLLSKFFPDEYSKLKGHVIYHTNNLGPSIGRSGDFAVFAALWNAIHNKPAKQVIFTGKITDDGTFYPVGGVEQKNKCAQALKKPIVVGPHNFVALKGIDNLNAERSEALMNIKLLEKLHLSKKLDQLILNILSQYNLNKDVLLVESLPDLVTLMYNHPNLDHAALEKINGYKPFVERHRRVLQAIMAFCATTGGVYMYSHQDN